MTVVTPTCGRASLSATICSVLPQLERDDELIVAGDGPQPYAAGLCRLAQDETAGRVVYVEAAVPGSVFGNGQRDIAIGLARGSHLCFLDDDDVYQDGALDAFRHAADHERRAVHVFKAEWGLGHHAAGTVLWEEPFFVHGNVGTPMVVFPREARLPAWMSFNDHGVVSDFGWMSSALGLKRIRWHEQLVATVRPEAV